MTSSYENCPKCNECKHVLNACTRCGFQRNPIRRSSLSRNQRKPAGLIASRSKSEWEAASQLREHPRIPKTSAAKSPSKQHKITGTQLTTLTKDANDIIVGLDFGTSCTKVIIRDHTIKKTYAVPFGKLAYDGHPYLAPTKIFAENNGCLSLETGEFALSDLKIKLLGSAEQNVFSNDETAIKASALEICAGYLALVLGEVVSWFLNIHEDVYRNTYLIWQLNIGMPSRSYDDKEQCKTFRLLALAAWRTMAEKKPVTIEGVREAIAISRQDIRQPENHTVGEMHPDYAQIVPEVIAESVGYAGSNLRREGTHLLVDVGAGTLDVAMFILHTKDGEDQYALLTAEVKQFGAYSLHRQRVIDVEAYVKEQMGKILAVNDGISPLPPLASYKPVPIDGEGLRKIDNKFRSQCVTLVSSVIHETKTCRNPLAQTWETKLPVLLCGGGCRIGLYDEAVKLAGKLTIPKADLDFIDLPKPENLEAEELSPGSFHRLAVAYGLSTRYDLIGSVIPPKVIPDIPRQIQTNDYTVNFISIEMT